MKVRPLGATFVIVSDGDACVVVEEGLCVQTGNFPYAYRHGASCRILVRRDADIWCPVFDMHPGGPAYPDGDVLYVDEIAYKGQDGPQGNFTARNCLGFRFCTLGHRLEIMSQQLYDHNNDVDAWLNHRMERCGTVSPS